MATDEQIISKHERMNLRAARAKRNTLDVVCVNAILKANGEFIKSKDKKVRHPCLIPRWGRIAAVDSPLTRTESEVVEMQA